MSRSRSDSLRRALRELAEGDAGEVVALAREGARNRARKLVEDALLDELLEAVGRMRGPLPEKRTAVDSEHPPAVDDATPDENPSSGQAWWTYCVLSGDDAERIVPELEGIEPGSAVEVVREGELAALVSAVPAGEYDDERLREHLEDLEWVERTARRHESVLEAALEHVTLVPLRLCTIYHDVAGVRGLLLEQAAVLTRSLAKVEDCAEWGVKVFAGEIAVPPPDESADETAPDRAGATYLLHRRREREQAEREGELGAACAETVHEHVSRCARSAITNPPQRPELHGREMAMILNGAYLVTRDRERALYEAIASLQAEWGPQGFVVELTGPWPAYNFVSETAGMVP